MVHLEMNFVHKNVKNTNDIRLKRDCDSIWTRGLMIPHNTGTVKTEYPTAH